MINSTFFRKGATIRLYFQAVCSPVLLYASNRLVKNYLCILWRMARRHWLSKWYIGRRWLSKSYLHCREIYCCKVAQGDRLPWVACQRLGTGSFTNESAFSSLHPIPYPLWGVGIAEGNVMPTTVILERIVLWPIEQWGGTSLIVR